MARGAMRCGAIWRVVARRSAIWRGAMLSDVLQCVVVRWDALKCGAAWRGSDVVGICAMRRNAI
eukprot:10567562-Lingulodinium_polyedra.AAC.1